MESNYRVLPGTVRDVSGEPVLMIPVVVHIVHRNDEQNISDAVIRSQIEVLNNDYRRRNIDRVNTPALFTPVSGDTKIQFYLACTDPQGNPTSGIIRKRTIHTSSTYGSDNRFIPEYNTVAFDSESGSNSWDNTRYLNIYVADFFSISSDGRGGVVGDGILGVAHFPHEAYTLFNQAANSTNVVSIVQIDFRAFGTGATYLYTGYTSGRATTHEIGHWLELRHIWGDDGGACTGSDFVDDTPNQAGLNFDCPSHPLADVCNATAVMFMNYMDYTNDNCKNIFTNGQKVRMRNALNPATAPEVRRNLTYQQFYLRGISQLGEYYNPTPNSQAVRFPNRTYAINGYTSGTTTWSVTSGITIVSQSNSSITVTGRSGFPEGTIEAVINNGGPCGNIRVEAFSITVNNDPSVYTTGGGTSCDNGTSPFAVASASYSNQRVYFQFNANNLSSVNWAVKQGSTTITNGSIDPVTLNTLNVYTGTLGAGTYDFVLDGVSCNGSASRSFTVGGGGSSLSLNQSTWSPSSTSNTLSVSVTSNIAWSASTSDGSWLTASPTSGSSNGSFTMSATANGATSSRSGIITVSGSGVSSQTVNVIQAGTGGGTPIDRTEGGTSSDDGASNPGSEGEAQAFDNTTNTKWLVFNSTGNIGYDFAGDDNYAINSYTVASANDSPDRDPKNWNLQGSNDGSNWTNIDSQNNQNFGGRFEIKPYSISNTTAYKQYRLNVTANNGSGLLQIGEIQMFGPAGTGGGMCSYTNGQFLTEWFGNEIVRAYICGTKYYAKNDAGYFKSKSWLTGTGRFTAAELNCFEEVNPGCGGLRIASGLIENDNSLEVFPNPTNGKIKVSFTIEKDENVWFNLYDTQGKNLQLNDFEGKKGRNEVEFDLQNYTSGTYFIDLQYNQKREVRKVMKVN